MRSSLISLAILTLLSGAARAETPVVTEHSLSGNLSLNSDYRFRGISQTWKLPAVQGGLDYAHSSGLYAGTWASNVSGNSYNNGAGLELDLYGGYKLALTPTFTLDLGALAYVYPGAKLNSAPGVATAHKYDNLDIYLGLSAGTFSAKLSLAASDYFGLNADTAGFAFFNSLAANGSSKGSTYLELNYSLALAQGLTLGAHAGHLNVRNYGALSYSDLKLSLAKEMLGLNWSAAVVATDADRAYYQAGNAAGVDAKRLGSTGLVLSVAKSF